MPASRLFLAIIFCDIFFLFSGSQDTFPGGVLNGRGGVVAPAPLQPRAATIESVFLPLQVRRVVIASILWKPIGVMTMLSLHPLHECTIVLTRFFDQYIRTKNNITHIIMIKICDILFQIYNWLYLLVIQLCKRDCN